MRGLGWLLVALVMGALLGGCRRHTVVDVDAYVPKLRYGMTEAEVIALIGAKPALSSDSYGVKTMSYLDVKNRERHLELLFHHDSLTAARLEVEDPALLSSEPLRTERRIDLPGDPDLVPKKPVPGTLPPGLAN